MNAAKIAKIFSITQITSKSISYLPQHPHNIDMPVRATVTKRGATLFELQNESFILQRVIP